MEMNILSEWLSISSIIVTCAGHTSKQYTPKSEDLSRSDTLPLGKKISNQRKRTLMILQFTTSEMKSDLPCIWTPAFFQCWLAPRCDSFFVPLRYTLSQSEEGCKHLPLDQNLHSNRNLFFTSCSHCGVCMFSKYSCFLPWSYMSI